MSNDAVQILTLFPKIVWNLFTGFKIPGLNFTPAVFFFGILSFSLAMRFIFGIINVNVHGFDRYARIGSSERRSDARWLRRREVMRDFRR